MSYAHPALTANGSGAAGDVPTRLRDIALSERPLINAAHLHFAEHEARAVEIPEENNPHLPRDIHREFGDIPAVNAADGFAAIRWERLE